MRIALVLLLHAALLSQPAFGQSDKGLRTSEAVSRAAGRYQHVGADADILALRGDGTWFLRQSGKNYDGTFTVAGDTVIMSQRGGATFTGGVIDGERLLDADGSVWQRVALPFQIGPVMSDEELRAMGVCP